MFDRALNTPLGFVNAAPDNENYFFQIISRLILFLQALHKLPLLHLISWCGYFSGNAQHDNHHDTINLISREKLLMGINKFVHTLMWSQYL